MTTFSRNEREETQSMARTTRAPSLVHWQLQYHSHSSINTYVSWHHLMRVSMLRGGTLYVVGAFLPANETLESSSHSFLYKQDELELMRTYCEYSLLLPAISSDETEPLQKTTPKTPIYRWIYHQVVTICVSTWAWRLLGSTGNCYDWCWWGRRSAWTEMRKGLADALLVRSLAWEFLAEDSASSLSIERSCCRSCHSSWTASYYYSWSSVLVQLRSLFLLQSHQLLAHLRVLHHFHYHHPLHWESSRPQMLPRWCHHFEVYWQMKVG